MAYTKETPAQGVQPRTFEHGLVGLDPAGKVGWRTTAKDVDSVAGASDRYVVGTNDPQFLNDEEQLDASKPVRSAIIVFDPATGKILWQQPELIALGLDGDTVLAVKPHVGGKLYSSDHAGTLVALDAATGQQRWTWDERQVSAVDVPFVGDGVVVLATVKPGARSFESEFWLAIRDTRTGTVLHEERGADAAKLCVSDRKTAVVCQNGYTVFAYDPAARRRTWNLDRQAAQDTHTQLRSMAGGRLFVATDSGGAILDATSGKQVASNLPGAPHQIRGAYAVVKRQTHGYDVYRLTG
jgi:outer membrane protein assembly factor BamB